MSSEPFPLHQAVANRDIQAIEELLAVSPEKINQRDWHGNPPLHLAIHLKFHEIVELLLEKGADPSFKNGGGWNSLDEAIASEQKKTVEIVLKYFRMQGISELHQKMPELLTAIEKLPDFYLELKWEFKSWIPFVSKFCPQDTYKVWKRGSSLRVDTTLVGFQNLRWQRGNVSIVLTGKETS